MRLRINGDSRDVPSMETILDLLHHFGLDQKIVVVEHNRVIVLKENYASTRLAEDDQVELVHFVGGG